LGRNVFFVELKAIAEWFYGSKFESLDELN